MSDRNSRRTAKGGDWTVVTTRLCMVAFVMTDLLLVACGSTNTTTPTAQPTTRVITIPTPPPTPSGASCLTPPGPASPLTGIGADTAAWNTRHRADPNNSTGYDPMPNTYPGSATQDAFSVMFANGRVNNYIQQFPPMTSQATAEGLLKDLPTDACPLDQPTALGKCAGQYFQSASLGAAEAAVRGPAGGIVSISFQSTYGLAAGQYDAGDVRSAFVQLSPGGIEQTTLPSPGSALANAFCGG